MGRCELVGCAMSAQPQLDRAQWLAERKSYIGATDLAAIVGKNKYKTAVDVFLDKTGQKEDGASSRKAEAGLTMEPLVLKWFTEDTGIKVKPGRLVRHPEFPFLAANLDGETEDGDLVEAKTMDFTTREEWGEPGTDEVPEAYYVQAVVQLGYVTLERVAQGLKPPQVNWVPRLDRGTMKSEYYAVTPQPEIFELCVRAGIEFKRKLDIGIPPNPTERDADNLIHLFPTTTGEILVSDPNLDAIASDMREAWTLQREWEAKLDSLRDRMKVAIGPAAGVETIEGKFSLSRRPGKVKWQQVAMELGPTPELVSKHTGEQFLVLTTPFKAQK